MGSDLTLGHLLKWVMGWVTPSVPKMAKKLEDFKVLWETLSLGFNKIDLNESRKSLAIDSIFFGQQ